MIAAAPNAGKSMLALVYAIRAGVRTLFFSADTDASTVTMRAAAALSQHAQNVVEESLRKNPRFYDEELARVTNIEWVFDSSPSLDDIELEIKAYVELYGEMPELIVIDNLMNIVTDSENEWAALRSQGDSRKGQSTSVADSHAGLRPITVDPACGCSQEQVWQTLR